jgi:hypothetical protein
MSVDFGPLLESKRGFQLICFPAPRHYTSKEECHDEAWACPSSLAFHNIRLCTSCAPSNHAADEQAISRLNEQLLKAYNLGDVNTLERIEDADFLVAGDFGEVSKSQQLDDVRHRKDNPTSVALTVSHPRFRFYGDTALLTEV